MGKMADLYTGIEAMARAFEQLVLRAAESWGVLEPEDLYFPSLET